MLCSQWQEKLAKLTSFYETEVIKIATAQAPPQKPPAKIIALPFFFLVPVTSSASWPWCPPDNLSGPESGLNVRLYHQPDLFCLKLLTGKEKKRSGHTAFWQIRKQCPPEDPFWTLCCFCVFVIIWPWNV